MQKLFSLIVAGLAFAVTGAPAAPNTNRPNILVILADDLGYGELTCQGNAQIPTPHIDSLAKNGIRCASGYVSGAVCSPSRAGLMTGRYQQRFGYEFNPQGQDVIGKYGLPVTEKTFAERMKAAGYVTGLFGKWHLGYKAQFHPQRRGFDEYVGFLRAQHDYFKNTVIDPITRGRKRVKSFDYTTDLFARETAAFIANHRAQPWFACLSFNAVHIPLQALDKHKQRFPNIADPKRKTFAGMVSAMDDAVGVVLAKLRELQLEDNTLIFFLSDNGGPTAATTARNNPLRGFKNDLLEGGVRVPFLVQWKSRLPAGRVEDRPIIALDILPTSLAAAGQPGDATLEGVNLLPYLTGKNKGAPHPALFWRAGKKRAVRLGDWKLTDQGDGAKLYNLAADIGETNDLAAKEPGKLKELSAAYEKWNARNVASSRDGKGKRGKKQQPPAALAEENDQ
jgi:arylsulfatase A-like enzyme